MAVWAVFSPIRNKIFLSRCGDVKSAKEMRTHASALQPFLKARWGTKKPAS